MAKYSLDFKLKVIQFYLSGNGYRQTTHHFNIEQSIVQKWARFYEAHGIEVIKPRTSINLISKIMLYLLWFKKACPQLQFILIVPTIPTYYIRMAISF